MFFVGDLHGYFDKLKSKICYNNNSNYIQLGDFGVGFSENDFSTLYPHLAREWHPTLNKIKASEIAPVPTSAFPTPAVRPHNSRLDTGKLQTTFGLKMPHWQAGVARMLAEIL